MKKKHLVPQIHVPQFPELASGHLRIISSGIPFVKMISWVLPVLPFMRYDCEGGGGYPLSFRAAAHGAARFTANAFAHFTSSRVLGSCFIFVPCRNISYSANPADRVGRAELTSSDYRRLVRRPGLIRRADQPPFKLSNPRPGRRIACCVDDLVTLFLSVSFSIFLLTLILPHIVKNAHRVGV